MSGYGSLVLAAHHRTPGSWIAGIACLFALFAILAAGLGGRK